MKQLQNFWKPVVAAMALTAIVSGCSSYDYLSHSDTVSFGAGNAVNGNLEMQTDNPTKDSQYDVTGLGEDGSVISDPNDADTTP